MFAEFKKFIMRGNVLDLAIGVIIGAAFGKIVTSLVGDVLMPVIGLAAGKMDFSNFFVSLNGQSYPTIAAAKAAGAPTLNYGLFINTVIEFLIVAFVIFLDREAGEPVLAGPAASSGLDQRVPAVLHGDPAGGQALPGVHVGAVTAAFSKRKSPRV